MRYKYRQWAVDFLTLHPEVVLSKVNFDDAFFIERPFRIEIGSGKGDFIIGMAKKYPEINFLAIEKVQTVAGMMVKKIVDEDLKNVKVFANDIRFIFDDFKVDSVDELYLNFVDPWPKKRHAKRRLTFIDNLKKYYQILKPGSKLTFKSDNDGLYEFTLEELSNTNFKIVENSNDYKFDENNDSMSEYEKKFRLSGKNINRIVAFK